LQTLLKPKKANKTHLTIMQVLTEKAVIMAVGAMEAIKSTYSLTHKSSRPIKDLN
jgi:hypothetical protein